MTEQHETQDPTDLSDWRRAQHLASLPGLLDTLARNVLWDGEEAVPPEHADALREYLRTHAPRFPGSRPRRIKDLAIPEGLEDLLIVVERVTEYLMFVPEQIREALTWIQLTASQRARTQLLEALHSLPPEGGTVLRLVPSKRKLSQPKPDEIDSFVTYVLGFYADPESCCYSRDWDPPWDPPTESEVREATSLILKNYEVVDAAHPLGQQRTLQFEGLSHDREVVRDVLLLRRGWPAADLEWHAVIARLLS